MIDHPGYSVCGGGGGGSGECAIEQNDTSNSRVSIIIIWPGMSINGPQRHQMELSFRNCKTKTLS